MTRLIFIRRAATVPLRTPLDILLRLEICPASISIVSMDQYGPRVLCINNMEEISDY